MPNPALSAYQTTIANLLRRLYPDVPVQEEWSSIFERNLYSPRIDVAVGPFSVVHGVQLTEQYNELMLASSHFFMQLSRHHLTNMAIIDNASTEEEIDNHISDTMNNLWGKNQNSRCLIAVEIENEVSRKHLMGGAINAAALGRIGIAVAWTAGKLQAFANLKRYLDYLASVHKNTFNTANLIILSAEQLQQAIEQNIVQ